MWIIVRMKIPHVSPREPRSFSAEVDLVRSRSAIMHKAFGTLSGADVRQSNLRFKHWSTLVQPPWATLRTLTSWMCTVPNSSFTDIDDWNVRKRLVSESEDLRFQPVIVIFAIFFQSISPVIYLREERLGWVGCQVIELLSSRNSH